MISKRGPRESRPLGSRPVASSDSVRSRMSKQRRRDTQAELLIRQLLHARGIRYRVDARPEPDYRCKADIMWRSLRLIVFVDGCFWHGCPDHATRPRANSEWWAQKLDANIQVGIVEPMPSWQRADGPCCVSGSMRSPRLSQTRSVLD